MWSWLKGMGRRVGSTFEAAGRVQRGGERCRRRQSPWLEALEDRVVPVVQAVSLANTTMLSDTAAGNVQGPSSVSKDGRYVVYADSAANLASGQVMDSKSAEDVFLYDRKTGATTLVSYAAGLTNTTTTAHGTSKNPAISADGKWVAYVSNSDNLLASFHANGVQPVCDAYEVYLYNVAAGTTTLVSHVASDQTPGTSDYQTTLSDGTSGVLTGTGGSSSSLASQTTSVSLSSDGSVLTYVSTGAHLVSGQQAGAAGLGFTPAEVFVYDRAADTNYLVNRSWDTTLNGGAGGYSSTTPGNYTSYVAVINQDGNTIAFTSQDSNLVKGQHGDSSQGFVGGEFEQYFVAQRSGTSWAKETTALITHAHNDPTMESTASTTDADYPAPAITPDGHYIAYVSVQDNLETGFNLGGVQGDNYYLYDTTNDGSTTNNNTLVSHKANDTITAGDAGPGSSLLSKSTGPAPAVSDNGRFVAFASTATNLTGTATSAGDYNVFLFDRLGTVDSTHNNITRVTQSSIPPASVAATTFPQLTPSISGDGRYVAYVGFASADVSGVNNLNGTTGLDALLYDQGPSPGSSTATYTLLSHKDGSPSTTGNASAYAPVLDEDGTTVIYLDDANNLIQGTVNGHTGQDLNAALPTDGTDLFAYSLTTPSGYTPQAANGSNATVTLRDPNLPSLTANGLSEISSVHAVSDDGGFTVFISNAPNLVAGEVDTNLTQNVYLYNRASGAVTLLSHKTGAAATTGDGESANAVISGDGKTVVFYSFATDLTSDTISKGTVQLYLYDNDPNSQSYGTLQLITNQTTSNTRTQGTNGTLPGSPNGLTGYSTLLYSNSLLALGLALPAVSANGQYIAFLDNATNLSDTNTGSSNLNVFLYDRSGGTNKLVSHANGSASSDNGNASTVAISADGSTLAFTSNATNLLSSSISTSGDQLYVWGRTTNSANGLSEGQTVLASHADSGNTTAASFAPGTDSSSWGPLPASLSKDGSFVAYYFGGNNLVASQGGTASATNVFRYDVKNNSNKLVSHANSGAATAGDNPTNSNLYEASGPAISSTGEFIAYANNSTNLLTSSLTGQNGQDNVYLFDANQTATLQNTLVSHKDGAAATPDTNGGTSPSISSDGRYVSFIDLALDTTADVTCTFSNTGAVRLYDSQATATTQPQKLGNAFNPTTLLLVGATLAPTVMSADGKTVAWDGLASDVVSGDRNGNLDVFENVPTADPAHITAPPTSATQTVTVGQSVPTDLTVTVTDASNKPIPGVTVTFAAPTTTTASTGTFTSGNKQVSTIQITTDSSGVAKVPFTANTISGSYVVTASVPNSTGTLSTSFNITNNPDVPAQVNVTASPTATATVHTGYTGTMQVQLSDKYNNAEQTAYTVTFTAPTTGPSGTFTGGTNTIDVTTNTSGYATAPTFTANTISGSYQVTATYTPSTGPALTTSFSLTNTPDVPATITALAGTPQSTIVNTAFATDLQAQLKDQYNNLEGSGFKVTFTAPAADPTGTFTGGKATIIETTDSSGVATAPFTASTKTGSYTVTATYTTASNTTLTANFALTNKPDVPYSITALAGTPQSTTVTTDFGTPLQAQLQDQYGNLEGNGITVTFAAPGSGPSGTFSGGGATIDVTTDSSGVATAPLFTASKIAGAYTVTASTAGVSPDASYSLKNTPDVPANVVTLSGSPQTTTVTTAFSTALQAAVTDQYGNAEPGVTVTFVGPTSGPGGTFTGGFTTVQVATNSAGVATAPTFTANTAAGSYTVTASVQGVSTPASFTLTNAPGKPAAIVAVGGTPQTTPILLPYQTPLQVQVTDAYGNPVPGAANVQFGAPPGGPSGTFDGGSLTASVTTDANGVGTTPTFTANGITGTFVVSALLQGVGTAQFQLDNLPPPPKDIVYVDGSWTGLSPGSKVNGPGGTVLYFGSDAVATIQDAESIVAPGGKIVVAGGTYSGSVAVARAGTVQLNGPVSIAAAGGDVSFGSATTVTGPGSLLLDGAHNVTLAGPLSLGGNLIETNGSGATALSAGTVGGSIALTTLDVVFGPGGLSAVSIGVDASHAIAVPATTTLQAASQVVLFGGYNNPAGGAITVAGTVTAPGVFVLGGPGPDKIGISSLSGGMNIDAGGGVNSLTLDLSSAPGGQTVTVTANEVTSTALAAPIFYGSTGGTLGGLFTVLTGPGADSVAIQSILAGAPTVIDTGAGDDSISVGSAGVLNSVLSTLAAPLSIDAGSGSNQLLVSEGGQTTPDTAFITGASIVAQSDPSGIWYHSTGGTYGNGVVFVGSSGSETVVVLGTAPGAPTTIYGRGNNDTFNVGVTSFSGYHSLTLEGRGGGAAAVLGVYDTSGFAAMNNLPTGPGSGVVETTYLQGATSVIDYQNIGGIASNVSTAQDFIEALYRTELGRDALPGDLTYWLGQLQTAGAASVVDRIDRSQVAADRLVSSWYERYLNRAPGGGEEQGYVARIEGGEAEETVLADLLAQGEFQKLAGGTDANYVQRLFQQLLNRTASPDEVAIYVNTLLPQAGHAGAAWLMLTSLDHRRLAVAEEYQTLYHRTGLAVSDLDFWAASGTDLLTIHERLETTLDFITANS